MRHFLQGVISKTGDRVISGLRHNKSTITKAYKSLQKKGLITIGIGDEIKGTNSFAINFKKILQGAKDMAKLKIGKKRQKQSENTTKVGVSQRDRGGVSEGQGGCLRGPTNKNTLSNNTLSKNTNPASAGSALGIREAVEKAKQKNAAATKRKASTLSTRGISRNGIAAAWRQLLSTHYPDTTINLVVTPREYGMLKASYEATNMPVPLPEFMEWAVVNWTELVDYDFRWCSKNPPPAIPSLQFFATMFKYFVSYYGNQQARSNKRKGSSDVHAKRARRLEQNVDTLQTQLDKERNERLRAEQRAEHFQKTAAKRGRDMRRYKVGDMKEHKDLNFQEIDDLPDWNEVSR